VVGMDVKKNLLIVGEEKDLYKTEMKVEKLNWLSLPLSLREANEVSDEAISSGSPHPFGVRDDILVQIRYRHEAVPCTVEVGPRLLKVRFKDPQRAVTPGQSAVFYRSDQVLGGGIIK